MQAAFPALVAILAIAVYIGTFINAGRMRHRRAGFHDAFTFDQYFAGSEKFSTFDIERPRGVQHHGPLLSEDRARHQND